jgi:ABC-type Mn2+/Zn2+ transport system permease subunit
MEVFDLLLQPPLQQAFMLRGLLAVTLVGILCAVVGSFVVLRGLAFIGEAMRHALFAGVVISFLLGQSLLIGPIIFALLIAWLISLLGQQRDVGEDTAIGIMFSASFALGIVLLNFARTGIRDLTTIFLGNVLGISTLDLVLTAIVTVLVLVLIAVFWKELILTSFDPAVATAQGRSLIVWNGLLIVLLALALIITFQTVGNLLALALLLTPAATARLLTQRLLPMMALASALAVGAGVFGLFLSYWGNLPPGPVIVIISGSLFGLALLFAPHHGVLWEQIRRRQMRQADV